MLTHNLLPKQQSDYLASWLLSPNFPHYYSGNIHSGNLTDRYDNDLNATGFSHRFYDNLQQHSDGLHLVMPYLWALLHRNGLRMKELLRVRSFMSLQNGSQHNGFPHIDIPNFDGYMTAIVYVVGADGDTILYNETFNGEPIPKPDTLTEMCRITPKPNSGIVFDGHRYHTGLLPQTSKVRLVLNYNFTVDAASDAFVAPNEESEETP
jgi:hypothetical protein